MSTSHRDALSPREVAERSGFSYHAILRAIRRGDLEASEPVPGRYRIMLAEYERWCAVAAASENRTTAIDAEIARLKPDVVTVYIIQRGEDGPLKIGRVKRPAMLAQRVRMLQTGSAEPLHVRRLLQPRLGESLESILHRRFAEHRLEGEWFAPAPEILAYKLGGEQR